MSQVSALVSMPNQASQAAIKRGYNCLDALELPSSQLEARAEHRGPTRIQWPTTHQCYLIVRIPQTGVDA